MKQTKPSWDNVFKNYPKNSSGGDLDVSNVCALIGGELSNSGITNACAIRVSRALNYSGITIPEIVGQTKKGGDGKNYFLYASHLKNWLSKVLGPPDIHKKVSEIGIDPSKYYDHLIGIQNRGIYIMKPKSAESFGATGHATLWGGLDWIVLVVKIILVQLVMFIFGDYLNKIFSYEIPNDNNIDIFIWV
jgi:hypothetical protein